MTRPLYVSKFNNAINKGKTEDAYALFVKYDGLLVPKLRETEAMDAYIDFAQHLSSPRARKFYLAVKSEGNKGLIGLLDAADMLADFSHEFHLLSKGEQKVLEDRLQKFVSQ